MKLATTILYFIFVFTNASETKIKFSLLNGLWIDESYDYTIRGSFSPFAASHTTIVPALSIDTSNKLVTVCYNFHEANEFKIISFDSLSGKVSLSNNSHNFSFEHGRLFFSHKDYSDNYRNRIFKRISDVANSNVYDGILKYVTPLVISGIFKDAKDNIFKFINNETIWQKRTFKWAILLDYVEFNPINQFCEVDKNNNCIVTYGFVSNGNMLQIYEYDDNQKIIGPLLHNLLRIN